MLGERATALLARRAAASRVAAAAIALAALAARTPLAARTGPREVDTSTAAAATRALVTGQPLRPLHLPEDLLVAAVTAPTAVLAARAAAAAPRSVAEAAHTAAVLRCAKLLEGARGSEAAGARGCEATLGRRDGRASDRSDPWIQRGGNSTATATAMATAMAGSRGRGGWSHPRESVPGAARSKQQTQQRVQQRAQAPRAAQVVRSGHSFFPYNHGPGKLRGEAAPFMPPRLKPGSATSTASATSAASTASATSAASAGAGAQPHESAEGKCRPGSPLPYRWPGRPMTPPVE